MSTTATPQPSTPSTSHATSPANTQPVVGSFCWWELCTRDTAQAQKFYTDLVGWTTKSCASGGDEHAYTEWMVDGKPIGGMMKLPATAPAHVPASWGVYVNVDDVDAATDLAKKLGGTVVMAPTDCPGIGRLSTITDPTGAALNLFKGLPGCGTGGFGSTPRHFCWIELLTNDLGSAERFYAGLFGWQATKHPMHSTDYTVFSRKGFNPAEKAGCVGGLMKIDPAWGNVPSNWLSYIWVDNCDATAARVESLGGKLCCQPTDLPGAGRFAVATDPTGASFGLYSIVKTECCKPGGCGCSA